MDVLTLVVFDRLDSDVLPDQPLGALSLLWQFIEQVVHACRMRLMPANIAVQEAVAKTNFYAWLEAASECPSSPKRRRCCIDSSSTGGGSSHAGAVVGCVPGAATAGSEAGSSSEDRHKTIARLQETIAGMQKTIAALRQELAVKNELISKRGTSQKGRAADGEARRRE